MCCDLIDSSGLKPERDINLTKDMCKSEDLCSANCISSISSLSRSSRSLLPRFVIRDQWDWDRYWGHPNAIGCKAWMSFLAALERYLPSPTVSKFALTVPKLKKSFKPRPRMNLANTCVVQPVPWKMRLEMLNWMVIEILNGEDILVN